MIPVEVGRGGGRNLGVLGGGRMGIALATLYAEAGHDVVLGTRTPRRFRDRNLPFAAAGYRDAAAHGKVVILATAWHDTMQVLSDAGPLAGKLLMDATNPEAPDGRTWLVPPAGSAAEEIALHSPGARVVKAWNHVYAEVLEKGPAFGTQRATVFLCGDDAEAREEAAELIRSTGFQPQDAGGLQNARFVEALGKLLVEMVRGVGYSAGDVAFHLLVRNWTGTTTECQWSQ